MGAWQGLLQKIMREYGVSKEEAIRILVTVARTKALHGGTEKEAHHGESETGERSAFQGVEQKSRQ